MRLNNFSVGSQFYLLPERPRNLSRAQNYSLHHKMSKSICDLVYLGVCWVMVNCLTGSLGSPYAIFKTLSPIVLAWAYFLYIKNSHAWSSALISCFYNQKLVFIHHYLTCDKRQDWVIFHRLLFHFQDLILIL